MTWPQSVAEALCFGWIDGLRRRVDDGRYTIRFTPRRKSSKWSKVNVRMVSQLEAAGKRTPAGRAAFEARLDNAKDPSFHPNLEGYTAQKKDAALDPARLKKLTGNKPAWTFFSAQPPGYQRSLAWWVMQAALDETRDRRLENLIEFSATGKRIT